MPAAVNEMKTCSKCRNNLPVSQFDRCATHIDGLQYRCKDCAKQSRLARRYKELSRRREYYKEHREEIRQKNSVYDHGRVAQLRGHKWRRANPEKQAAATKRWKLSNRDRVRHHNRHRQARVRGAEGKFTLEEWLAKCDEYGQRCAYCHKLKKLTRHHVKPLIRGGSNFITNVVPACLSCNSRIHDRIVLPGEQIP